MTIAQNPRHVPTAKKLDEDGAATYLGTAETVTVDAVRDAVNYVLDDQLERAGMTRCARMMVDGKGPDRIVNGLEILHPRPGRSRPACGWWRDPGGQCLAIRLRPAWYPQRTARPELFQ